MKINFLGTNGWYSTKTGNVTCTLIESEKYYIIFDAGDGIYKAGNYLKKNKPIYLFLSHLHFDHIFGFHIFPVLLKKKNIKIILEKGNLNLLKSIIRHPFASSLKNNIVFHEVKNGKHILPIEFECLSMSHADKTMGYRLYLEDKIVSYCLDTGVCDNVVKLSKNADILITECSNLPGISNPQWGHLNSKEAAKMAKEAGVKKMILTHFGVEYKNQKEREMAGKIARKFFRNTICAKDDMLIEI